MFFKVLFTCIIATLLYNIYYSPSIIRHYSIDNNNFEKYKNYNDCKIKSKWYRIPHEIKYIPKSLKYNGNLVVKVNGWFHYFCLCFVLGYVFTGYT